MRDATPGKATDFGHCNTGRPCFSTGKLGQTMLGGSGCFFPRTTRSLYQSLPYRDRWKPWSEHCFELCSARNLHLPKLSKQWDDHPGGFLRKMGVPSHYPKLSTPWFGDRPLCLGPPQICETLSDGSEVVFCDDSQVAFWVHEAAMWEWVTSGPAVHRKHQQNGYWDI